MKKFKVWYVSDGDTLFPNRGEAADATYDENDLHYGELVCNDETVKEDLGKSIKKAYISCIEYRSFLRFFVNRGDAINDAVKNGYASFNEAEKGVTEYSVTAPLYHPVETPFEVTLLENEKGVFFKKALHPEVTGINCKKKVYFKDRDCHNELCKGTAIVTRISDRGNFGFFHAEMVKYPVIDMTAINDFVSCMDAYLLPIEVYKDTCIGDMLVLSDEGGFCTPYVMVDGHLQECDKTVGMWYLRSNHLVKSQLGYQLISKNGGGNTGSLLPECFADLVDLVDRTKLYFDVVELLEDGSIEVAILDNKSYIRSDSGFYEVKADVKCVRNTMRTVKKYIGADLVCEANMGISFDDLMDKFTEFDFDYFDAVECNSFISTAMDSAVDYGFINVKTINGIMFVDIQEKILVEALSDFPARVIDEVISTSSKINKTANESVISRSRKGKLVVRSSTRRASTGHAFMIV